MKYWWREFARKRGMLEDLAFWEERNRDWKWVLQCKLVKYREEEQKNSCGMCSETNGVYEGEWNNNTKEGYGKKCFGDKSVYMGQWKNNMKEGQGIYVWQDNTKYIGGWKEDKYHGFGMKCWSDGDKYQGNWKEDKKTWTRSI